MDSRKRDKWLAQRFSKLANVITDKMRFYDIFVIDSKGNILQTIAKEDDLGTNLISGKYKDTSLARVFAKGLIEPAISDIEFYAPSKEKISAFFAVPVKDDDGNVLGVLASQITMTDIDEIMQERSGLGETGETVLVGQNLFMRSNSRFSKDPTTLKGKIEVEAPRRALAGSTGAMWLLDYRNVPVCNAYAPLDIPGLKWVIVSKMDEEELLAPVYKFRFLLLIGLGILAALIFLVSYVFARRFTRPVNLLTNNLLEMAESGRYDHTIAVTTEDEIGLLVDSFNKMSSQINKQTIDLNKNQKELENELIERKQAERNLQVNQEKLEEINKEIEKQNRLKTGLHNLYTCMLGEQELSELGNNILKFIVTFLDLPLGALFILNSENMLQRVACYGYPKSGDIPESFALGTGLVGQAALEGKPITLRNIPEYAKVSFGFGQASPEEILLIPLIYNDQVVGVLELGSFKSFSESHLDWLEEAVRSISVVLCSNLSNFRSKT
jgi:methyl-accepting chemotaxis protein